MYNTLILSIFDYLFEIILVVIFALQSELDVAE